MEQLYNEVRQLAVDSFRNNQDIKVIEKKIDVIGNISSTLNETITASNGALLSNDKLDKIESDSASALYETKKSSEITFDILTNTTQFKDDVAELKTLASDVCDETSKYTTEIRDVLDTNAEAINTQMSNIAERIADIDTTLKAQNELEIISELEQTHENLREEYNSIVESKDNKNERIDNELDTLEGVIAEFSNTVKAHIDIMKDNESSIEMFTQSIFDLEDKIKAYEPEIKVDTDEDINELFGQSDLSLSELIASNNDYGTTIEFEDDINTEEDLTDDEGHPISEPSDSEYEQEEESQGFFQKWFKG